MAIQRLLRASDVAGALELSNAAGWNQAEADWLRVLDLEPGGCFVIEDEGRLAASATAITYGTSLAWIGMVLTLPEYRGRGFASELMHRCLDYCEARGVPCVKLDATAMGKPIYERFGFEDESIVERWKGELPPSEPAPEPPDLALDLEAFGADRSALLRLIGSSRPGRLASYLGPIVARTPEEARRRILATGLAGPLFWDVPLANPAAVDLAASLGFTPVRRLWRMRRGQPHRDRIDLVYALAGFEFG